MVPVISFYIGFYYDPGRTQNSTQDLQADLASWNYDTEKYEKIEASASAEHCGNAPFDFNYFGSMTLKNKEGKNYHLEAIYMVTGESFFYVMDDEQYEKYKEFVGDEEISSDSEIPSWLCTDETFVAPEEIAFSMNENDTDDIENDASEEEPQFLESYESLLEATASEFFPFFLELDQLTDKKVADVMMDVNDTRNYPCRIGSHSLGTNKPEIYIEMFNRSHPEQREYFQMIETSDHVCTYTASHESYYMQIEMGDIFELYFTKKREPEYYLQSNDQDFNKLDKRYQIIFNTLRHYLHTYARAEDSFVKIPDDQFYKEESEFFAEMFVTSMQTGDTQRARAALQEQETAMASCSLPKAKRLLLQTVIDARKYTVARAEENSKEIEQYRKAIISRKDQALNLEKELGEDAPIVFTSIANALLDQWRFQQIHNDNSQEQNLLEEILELMDHNAFSNEKEYSRERFEVYQAYAFCLDEKVPEKAEQYYQRALKEATKHHLDQNQFSAAAVAGTYNNYAWVLWNKLGSEEAIIYYGRAIELMETYLENGMLKPEYAKKQLSHYGLALMKIYDATSRQKELERLVKRLLNSGINPKELIEGDELV